MEEDNRCQADEAWQIDIARRVNTDTYPVKHDCDDQHRNNTAPAAKRRINMIMGGLQSYNDSVRSIKEYERKAITSQKWPHNTSNDAPLTFVEAHTDGWMNLKTTLQ